LPLIPLLPLSVDEHPCPTWLSCRNRPPLTDYWEILHYQGMRRVSNAFLHTNSPSLCWLRSYLESWSSSLLVFNLPIGDGNESGVCLRGRVLKCMKVKRVGRGWKGGSRGRLGMVERRKLRTGGREDRRLLFEGLRRMMVRNSKNMSMRGMRYLITCIRILRIGLRCRHDSLVTPHLVGRLCLVVHPWTTNAHIRVRLFQHPHQPRAISVVYRTPSAP